MNKDLKQGFWEKLTFKSKGDERGELVAVESLKEIPFPIKRCYYLIHTKEGVRRGYHAHKDLDQVLIAVTGSCRVLLDNGKKREEITLATPLQGLRIKDLVWREIYDFSENCVLVVLASDFYKEDDYIRNYQAFIDLITSLTK